MQTEWRGTLNLEEVFKGKFMKAGNLNGAEREVIIENVEMLEFEENGESKKKLGIVLIGEEQTFVCNNTNRKILQRQFGAETDDWLGAKLVLYPDVVNVRGEIVDTIKVRIPANVAENEKF